MHFKLSDDFDGDVEEALRQLGQYLMSPKPRMDIPGDADPTAMDTFMQVVNRGGRFSGFLGMAEGDGVEWTKRPTGIPATKEEKP